MSESTDKVLLYVTYGCGSNLANCFSVVEAENAQAAFDEVCKVCGTSYAFTYTHNAWYQGGTSQEKIWGLTKVPLRPQGSTT